MHNLEFYSAIAKSIDAENAKASAYVKHGQSLGLRRERILMGVLREATGSGYAIASGFLHSHTHGESRISSQCDIIVFEDTACPPKYRKEDMVVLHPGTVNLVVEVKSKINKARFDEALGIHESLLNVGPPAAPCFLFGYDSVERDSLIGYVRTAIRNNKPVPYVIHSHLKQVTFCSPWMNLSGDEARTYVVDWSKHKSPDSGRGTAAFLSLYSRWLQPNNRPDSGALRRCFNSLNDYLPEEARIWIDQAGESHTGSDE